MKLVWVESKSRGLSFNLMHDKALLRSFEVDLNLKNLKIKFQRFYYQKRFVLETFQIIIFQLKHCSLRAYHL